jgi:hypothetical protein
VTATARKLACVIYHLLKYQEEFVLLNTEGEIAVWMRWARAMGIGSYKSDGRDGGDCFQMGQRISSARECRPRTGTQVTYSSDYRLVIYALI